MKRQNLIFTVVTATVSVGTAIVASTMANMLFSPSATAQMHAATPSIQQIAARPKVGEPLKQGAFVGVDHPTKGSAKIVSENGKRYLEFDRRFKSDNGPDLFVLLHTQANPKQYQRENYIRLGRLQNVKGAQRYEIPADVDLADFKSAVIWCRQFNVTFGFAELG